MAFVVWVEPPLREMGWNEGGQECGTPPPENVLAMFDEAETFYPRA